ncbi:unnamed protein product, partial [Rotaria magnacalcarata]
MPPPVMMVPGYGTAITQVPVYTLPPAQPYSAPQPYPVVQPSYPSNEPPEIKPEDVKQ